MKVFLVLALFSISFCKPSQAQYHPLIDTNKTWQVSYNYDPDVSDILPGYYWNYFCYFKGDSIFLGTKYKKLLSRQFHYYYIDPNQNPSVIIDSSYHEETLYALMREDTASKKIYTIRYNGNYYEDLLYDFSLKAGDTLKSKYWNNNFIVDSIGLQTLLNGEQRRISHFKNAYAFYIEGVGGNNGLNEPIQLPPVSGVYSEGGIICNKLKDTLLYGNCSHINTSIREAGKRDKVAIVYPNPSSENITINLGFESPSTTIELTSLVGQVLNTNKFNNTKIINMELNAPPGLYFLNISAANGHFSKIKVIKN